MSECAHNMIVDGSGRDAHHRSDLAVAQVMIAAQHDGLSLSIRKLADPLADLFSENVGVDGTGPEGAVHFVAVSLALQQGMLLFMSPRIPQVAIRGIAGHAVHERLQRERRVQCLACFPQCDKDVLNEIVRDGFPLDDRSYVADEIVSEQPEHGLEGGAVRRSKSQAQLFEPLRRVVSSIQSESPHRDGDSLCVFQIYIVPGCADKNRETCRMTTAAFVCKGPGVDQVPDSREDAQRLARRLAGVIGSADGRKDVECAAVRTNINRRSSVY